MGSEGRVTNNFWAKMTKDGRPGKSVLSHMNDVRAVAEILLSGKEKLLSAYGMNSKTIACFAGLHDIGKISPGFQSKCIEWLKKNNLLDVARDYAWHTIHESDHSKITQYAVQSILQKNNIETCSAELWGALVGAHHGRLHQPGMKPDGCKLNDEWQNQREKAVGDLFGTVALPSAQIDDSWPLIWWLAGLVSVSDWIGSNEDYFFPDKIETTSEESDKIAVTAIKAIGFDSVRIQSGLSFGDIFKDENNQPFSPNDLQVKAGENITNSGLYVIEAPMGLGKTEAALWCAYKLMCVGKASGMYFALPTQTTSNRIYKRVQKFLARIFSASIGARLIHSGSWLLTEINMPSLRAATSNEKESIQDAKDWFASKKRALLAPFGVGTIDQALMSVIAVKHFFVRQFALAGKVIILDEVHSYDLYTGTLITSLCERLLPLGCTIIVLSATLTHEARERFIKAVGSKKNKKTYPLISGRTTGGNQIEPVLVKEPETKSIAVVFKNEFDVFSIAVEKAKNGASVLWVCDTVNRAQEMYQQLKHNAGDIFEKGLLHARFPLFRRQEIEDYWMEKLGKESKDRSGCILFSTQVVEQSVDLDADFMVSELAPTDMLLQRIGRLWRHPREKRPCLSPELCIIAENNSLDEFKKAFAKEIKRMFGAKANVYNPYVLLKSLQLWNGIKSVCLPSGIRKLLEGTYKIGKNEPREWEKLAEEIVGDRFAQETAARFETNVWSPLLNDEEGTANTRVNNYPTIQTILCKYRDEKKIVLLNDEIVELAKNTYSLSAARAVNRNIVRVPKHCFVASATDKDISILVRGDWQSGIVHDDGSIRNINLDKRYTLKYTREEGVKIMCDINKSEVEDEPCD